MNNSETGNSNLAYLLAGCAIGAGVALIFAPKSGKEMRDDISNKTLKGLEQAKSYGSDLSNKAQNVYHQIYDKAVNTLETAKEKLNAGVENGQQLLQKGEDFVTDKMNDGKDKAQSVAKNVKSQVNNLTH
ncbi:MAG: YtxH domain-containing protein [Pyrinomonadaceae bacterium]|nr:YtxH domain-containing protein [Pyrinomonadaceae bacterium]